MCNDRECPPDLCPSLRQSKTCSSSISTEHQYCRNTSIQQKSYPRTEIFRTSFCGLGLRLLEDVKANTIIIEYLGEVITDKEGTRRMSTYEAEDAFYFASLTSGYILDAKFVGSKARFANHSCEPTCELQKWVVSGEPRIVIASKFDLKAGTEITYNYQYFDDGMDKHSQLKLSVGNKRKKVKSFQRQSCHCGARRCAGTIGK